MSLETRKIVTALLPALLLIVGVVLIVSPRIPMVTVIVDNTPPVVEACYPYNHIVSSLTKVVALVKDPESGIKSVTCTIEGTTYELSYLDMMGGDYERWTNDIPDITASGDYSDVWVITNKANLTSSYNGTFSVYTALTGKWYVAGVEITSQTQTLYVTSTTVSFKFVKVTGVEDIKISCTIGEKVGAGLITLLCLNNTAPNTWEGNFTFNPGKHTLQLSGYDGTHNVIMSLIDLSVPTGLPLTTLQLTGICLVAVAIVVYGLSKKRK